MSRFTVEQVLRGMQAWIDDNWNSGTSLEPDRPLLDYKDEAHRQDECPLLTLAAIAEHFELDWSEPRWIVWLRLRGNDRISKHERQVAWDRWVAETAPTLTVRRLAETIARRAEGVSFAPAAVLGRRCASAGAFYGLCRLPELRGGRWGPSTPLRQAFQWRQLRSAWGRVEWITGASLPELRDPDASGTTPLTRIADASCIAAVAAGIAGAANLAAQCSWLLAAAVGAAGLLVAVELRRRLLYQLVDPLPADLQTLGDVARRIAG